MSFLRITEYSNYTDVYQLLYAKLKSGIIAFLLVLGICLLAWLMEELNLAYTILIIIFSLAGILAQPLADALKHGPKRRICQIAFDEITTIENIKIPIQNISLIEFSSSDSNERSFYHINIILKSGTSHELFTNITTRDLVLLHQTLKNYVDVPYVYKETHTFTEDTIHKRIEDLL